MPDGFNNLGVDDWAAPQLSNLGANDWLDAAPLPPPEPPPPPAPPPKSTLGGIGTALEQFPTDFIGGLVKAGGAVVTSGGTVIQSAASNADERIRSQTSVMDRIDAGERIQPTNPRADATALMADFPYQFGREYAALSPEMRAQRRANIESALATLPKPEDTGLGQAGQAVKTAGGAIMGAGKAVTAYGEAAFPLTDEEQQRFEVQTVKIAASLVPYLGAAFVGGLPAVIGLGGVQGFGLHYDDAKSAGASDADAAIAGTLGGLTAAGLNAVPAHKAMEALKALPNALKGEFLKTIWKWVESGATLTAFSQIQTVADNLLARENYDPSREPTAGLGEHLGPQFVAGMLVPGAGAALGGAARLAGRARPNVQPRPVEPPRPVVEDVINAPDLDGAIEAANQVAAGTPVPPIVAPEARTPLDVRAETAQLATGDSRDLQQAALLKLFDNTGAGTVEQAPDGGYHYRTIDAAGAEVAHPIEVWHPDAEPDASAIPIDTVHALRDHYGQAGVDVVFYKDDPAIPFDGAHDPGQPDTIFLSNNPARNIAQVTGHEFTHVLQTTTLPDGTSLGELLNRQIAAGITPAGQRYAQKTFGSTAPKRATFPDGPVGGKAHADALQAHLINELGTDIGGEAPKFQSFLPRVIDAIQARFGDGVAKDVLTKLIDGLRSTMETVRGLFGETGTRSQHWVSNIGEVHDTLAKMYAARFGTPVEREQAAVAAMRDKAERDRFTQQQVEQAPEIAGASPVGISPEAEQQQTRIRLDRLQDVGRTQDALEQRPLPTGWEIAPDPNSAGYVVYDHNDRMAGRGATQFEALQDGYKAADKTSDMGRQEPAPSPGITRQNPAEPGRTPPAPDQWTETRDATAAKSLQLRRWLDQLAAERNAQAANTPQARLLTQTEAAILRPVGGDETKLPPATQTRLDQVRQQIDEVKHPAADTPEMAKVRDELGATEEALSVAPAPEQPADVARTERQPQFTSENRDGLLQLPNGQTELGRVPDGLSVPAGSIELRHGWHNEATNRGTGLLHIEARHGAEIRAAGFQDAAQFVTEVAANYNEIRQDPNGRLFLVQRDRVRVRSGDPQAALIVGLVRDGGGWRVETAGRFKSSYINKREMLWQAVHTAAPQPDGMAAPSSAPPTQVSVSEGRLSARDQSKLDVSATQDDVNSHLSDRAPLARRTTRIRTIQQIQDEDGVGPRAATATQEAEIAAIGRPITEEEAGARKAGVKPTERRAEQPARIPASGLESINPADVGVDAQRFQFKAGGDESGVTDRLQGVEKWDQRLAGTVMVWRDENGKDWIADGHQRLGLATRLQADDPDIRMNAFVLDSKDGISTGQARAYAAAKNIAEGSGTAIDAAKVIREAAENSDINLPPLPPRSVLVRDGQALARLGPEAFGMAVNEVVPVPQAAIVGRLVTDPAQQAEAIRLLAQYHPENLRQTETIVRELLATGTEMRTQDSLFGVENYASSVVLERAKIIDEATRQLGRDRTTFAMLVNRADEIQGAGNQLATDTNKERLTTDERAAQTLQSLATTRGPVSDQLTAIAREFKAGTITRADAGRRFLGAVRRGADEGLDRGPIAGGAGSGDAGGTGDVIAPDDAGPPLFSPRRVPLPPASGAPLFGEAERAPAQKPEPEPTIRDDARQVDMFGKADAAVQAQAARDQAGRGGINPRGEVKPADEGLFAPDASGQRPLFSPRPVADINSDQIAAPGTPGRLQRIREWAYLNLRGQQVRSDALGAAVTVNKVGIEKTFNRAGDDILSAVPAIPDLLTHGTLLATAPPHNPIEARSTKAWHYLGGVVRVDGRDIRFVVDVREDHAGHYFYNLGKPREGGADRSGKAVPAAGTGGDSGERSAPDVDLNLNQFPGDRSGLTPDDNVIRSDNNRKGPQFSPRREEDRVPLFSALTRAVEGIKQEKATPGQWIATIKNMGGVKPEERAWTGVDDWLNKQPRSVTKAEVLDYLRAHQLDVREVTKGGKINAEPLNAREAERLDYFRSRNVEMTDAERAEFRSLAVRDNGGEQGPGGKTKFGEYTLPGGKSYREMLLTMPPKPAPTMDSLAAEFKALGIRERPEDVSLYTLQGHHASADLMDRFEAILDAQSASAKDIYHSAHWDEPNVVAHTRFDERTAPDGAKVLHVNEVQSDWHQAGRKGGYKGDEPTDDQVRRFFDLRPGADPAEYRQEMMQSRDRSSVPQAPFKTTWPMLAMKRMIQYAVDHGFDRVSWDRGDVQADRYSLARSVDRLTYIPGTNELNAYKDGRNVLSEKVEASKLPDYIGKETAERLMSSADQEGKDAARTPYKRLEGDDLKAGGAGMRGFYDRQLPSEVQKLVGKFGAKVGQSEVSLAKEYPDLPPIRQTVHSFDITDRMREAVQAEGLPLFSPRQRVAVRNERETEAWTPEQALAYSNVGRVVEVPTFRERLAAATDDIGRRAARYWLDPYIGLKRDDPEGYVALRNANTSAGAAEMFLRDGTLRFEGSTYAMDSRNGGVEHDLVRPLHGEEDKFIWWVAANRAERLSAEDRENLWSQDDIDTIKATNQGQVPFDYQLPNGQVTRSREAIYLDSLRKLDVFNKNALDLGVQSGLLDGDRVSALFANPFYVPFYRVAEADGRFAGPNLTSGFVKQNAFKTLRGGTEKLRNNLWDNAIKNWSHMIDASLRNRAAAGVLDTAVTNGAAIERSQREVDQMSKAERRNTVWVMNNGRQQHFEVNDPMLFTAISALDFTGFNDPFMKAATKFKTVLTQGVTSNPLFMLRNSIRDAQQAIAVSPTSYNIVKNFATGFSMGDMPGALMNLARTAAGQETRRLRLSNEAADAIAGGATMQLGAGHDTGVRLTDLDTMLDRPARISAFWNYVSKSARDYKAVAGEAENAQRFALYHKLIAEGVPKDRAAFAARDLTDFTLRGAGPIARYLTAMVPFMNARLQGLYKVGRSAADQDRNIGVAVGGRVAAGATKRMAIVLGATTLMTLALDALYADDEDYKKRTEYDRSTNHWFKVGDTQFRIPMGFEIAALSRIATNGAEAIFGQSEMTGRRFADSVLQIVGANLSMNPTPQAVRPVLDLMQNQNFAGTPIVGMGMDRLRSEEQYNPSTSLIARAASSAGNAAARAIGGPQARFLAPVQIDYLVNGYFGWLGSHVVNVADMMVRGADQAQAALRGVPTIDPVRPAADLWNKVTGGMISTQTTPQSRYVDMLYQQAEAVRRAYATHRDLIARGRVDDARAFYQANKDQIGRHELIEKVTQVEATANRQIKRIGESSTLSAEQKRVEIMKYHAMRNRAAENVFGARP